MAKASSESRVFRWLHISDIHFKEEETWDRRATLRALISKVRELKEDGLAPDLVFVTGDIAYSGKAKEYEQATRFFHSLNDVLALDPKDRWFLVPGNHDVDRSRISQSHRGIQAILTDDMAVDDQLRDGGAMRLLGERLGEYYRFSADYLGPVRSIDADRPWRTDVRELAGVPVGILQLNSAWVARGGEEDEAKLLVGKAQLQQALAETPDALIRIVLMHHPLRNLRDFDERSVKGLLTTSQSATFLLRGHLHLNRAAFEQSPDGRYYELAAGALHTDEERWPRGFHLGEIDLARGEARIHLFRFSDEGSGFFAADNLTYENAPKGICTIKLPPALRPDRARRTRNTDLAATARESWTIRYRQAAAAYHGHARFIGFPNQATRANARVSDLFVPLRMTPRNQGTKGMSRSTAEIAQALLGREHAARIVVLGDPGSGKTTLSRFLVLLAAGAITMPGVEVASDLLPMRVAFRDFMEKRGERRELSLIEYLEGQAKAELSLELPKNFLRRAILEGRAVLFMDGLDEVGSADQRAAMRDLVIAFTASHMRGRILVTTRIAGYDEAPLCGQTFVADENGVLVFDEARGFDYLRNSGKPGETLWDAPNYSEFNLEKFSDDDLQIFVARWYQVQEPSDTVARDRGVADLMGALAADERVRELARTPILATLIAMIHRVEANLPGERAKLYELCVRMLVETWPAQAKRPFAEIDAGLQRAYLESFAYDGQLRRNSYTREAVSFPRSELIERLLPILRKRDFAGEPEEKVRGTIGRWIDHLERGTGIFIEQSPGVYAFFHLSIMEYLAARGLERELGRDDAVASIAEHFHESAWLEVCLLAVGAHADDGAFLDAVFSGVELSKDIGKWAYLLLCLREEARFGPRQRETILKRYAQHALKYGSQLAGHSTVREICNFSVRHGEAARQWLEGQLGEATGGDLAEAALIASATVGEATVTSRISRRLDATSASAALLEFWPGGALGEWAAPAAAPSAILTWSRTAAGELAALRAVAALPGAALPLHAALTLGLAASTLSSGAAGNENLLRVSVEPRPGGNGLPARLVVHPGSTLLYTKPRLPAASSLGERPPYIASFGAMRFTREIANEFAGAVAGDPASTIAYHFSYAFARDFGSNFNRDFAGDFARRITGDFAHAFAPRYVSDLVGSVAGSILGLAMGELAVNRDSALNLSREVATEFFLDAWAVASGGEAERHLLLLRKTDDEAVVSALVKALVALMVGEAWIAVATTAKYTDITECADYFGFRLHHRWLLEVWNGIDDRLPANPTPAQLALYFALGWAQSTTTWAWPDTARWRTLFDASPGEHWLPRSQWHLCKLTENNQSKEDKDGLRAAVGDGMEDEELPGYAKRLAEILGMKV